MYRILIVEDLPLYRRGVKDVLTEELDTVEIRDASNGEEALNLVPTEPWDMIVLDINVPDNNGIALLQKIKHHKPRLPVLVLSTRPEEQYGVQLVEAGADGYLPKTANPSEVVSAVKKILERGASVTDSGDEQFALKTKTGAAKLPHQHLSEREFQVLRHVVAGKGPTEIAKKLDVSVTTVSTYRARILEKMHMKTNADLIRYALEHELLR